MRIEIFGARGTRPAARRRGSVYGGHTPCALVRAGSGETIIVDAGTGLHRLEESLPSGPNAPAELHLLLTHFHFDHLQGLPFFQALYRRRGRVVFYSAEPPAVLRGRLSGFMTGPYFPVEFSETTARKAYRRIGPKPVDIGSVRVKSCPLNHPQGSVAYR
ncbi:MAG: MBL fold metallo-hydrolase, partial [Candidatus Aminicenantes bacterium]|nr:MBL fold metallo-hydrolase [Candidatus Aminicenantes bacterium]